MCDIPIKEIVKEALRNAKKNGFDFEGWSNEEVAIDLMTYDADVEGYELDVVVKAVEEVRYVV